MSYAVINRKDLDHDGKTYEFQGYLHGDANVSVIWVDMPPGGGVRLHRHPYEEVFVIQEGRATFTVGAETLKAHAGQILIAPPGTPHKIMNSGEGPLR